MTVEVTYGEIKDAERIYDGSGMLVLTFFDPAQCDEVLRAINAAETVTFVPGSRGRLIVAL